MNVLVLGLYAEERTDDRFLPIMIQRTSELILAQYDRANIEALEPIVIKKGPSISSRDECILQAAQEAAEYHALVVHSDADNRTHKQTRIALFDPGYELVQRTAGNLCKNLLPIIPVCMVEAWMLADYEKLRESLGTSLTIRDLGLHRRPRQVELYQDPKEILKLIVQKSYPNQPGRWGRIIGKLYDELASEIRLERLSEVPAYRQFKDDLIATLKKLNFVH